MGQMIENLEIDMRSNLDQLYIQKTREVVSSIRQLHGAPKQTSAFTADLKGKVGLHGANRKIDSET